MASIVDGGGGGEKKTTVLSSRDAIAAAVDTAVTNVEVIDVHTHLFGPEHGQELYIWGIDSLLTYHYLVSEFFMGAVAPPGLSHDSFFAMSVAERANLVWEHLFVRRPPTSEACVGVLTVLKELGLQKQVEQRDLVSIRAWFAQWKGDPQKENEYVSKIFKMAGVKYCVMTNIPYVALEAKQWKSKSKEELDNPHFRSALRVDALLMGDWDGLVQAFLKEGGYPRSVNGVKQYLRDWAKTMDPLEYFIASTPCDFQFPCPIEGGGDDDYDDEVWPWSSNSSDSDSDSGIGGGGGSGDEKASSSSSSSSSSSNDCCGCDGNGKDGGSSGSSSSSSSSSSSRFVDLKGGKETNRLLRRQRLMSAGGTLFDRALIPVLRELNMALMIKAGACRGDSPSLTPCGGGDGIAGTNKEFPRQLLAMAQSFPRVKFCTTVLARRDQHELSILAQKFRNVHLYGCWWYCNTPSIIHSVTQQRLELLGSAFTAQHSDCRVLEQLLYKWIHSRKALIPPITERFLALYETGWSVTKEEIEQFAELLLGGQYRRFLEQPLGPNGDASE